jgi:hypothetical protein
MKTIDLKLNDIKQHYRQQKPILIQGLYYSIGLVCGAINEFRLFRKGKEYVVFSNYEENDTTFILLKETDL